MGLPWGQIQWKKVLKIFFFLASPYILEPPTKHYRLPQVFVYLSNHSLSLFLYILALKCSKSLVYYRESCACVDLWSRM